MLLKAFEDREARLEREAYLRAGIMPSVFLGAFSKPGSAPKQPRDFVPKHLLPDTQVLEPEDFVSVMRAWAERHNRSLEA